MISGPNNSTGFIIGTDDDDEEDEEDEDDEVFVVKKRPSSIPSRPVQPASSPPSLVCRNASKNSSASHSVKMVQAPTDVADIVEVS